MFWKKFNACTMGAVVTGSSLIHPPVSYFYTHNFPPVYFKHMWTWCWFERVSPKSSTFVIVLLVGFSASWQWWLGSCPTTISQPHTPASLEQIKWTQWFFNQITHAPNRLTFLTQVLFPLSSSPLLLSPQPEREWRSTNFNLHYLLWFLC